MYLINSKKIACTVYQLEREARSWWEVVLQIENAETVTCAKFLTHLYRKYLGKAQLSRKVHEFMNLT